MNIYHYGVSSNNVYSNVISHGESVGNNVTRCFPAKTSCPEAL